MVKVLNRLFFLDLSKRVKITATLLTSVVVLFLLAGVPPRLNQLGIPEFDAKATITVLPNTGESVITVAFPKEAVDYTVFDQNRVNLLYRNKAAEILKSYVLPAIKTDSESIVYPFKKSAIKAFLSKYKIFADADKIKITAKGEVFLLDKAGNELRSLYNFNDSSYFDQKYMKKFVVANKRFIKNNENKTLVLTNRNQVNGINPAKGLKSITVFFVNKKGVALSGVEISVEKAVAANSDLPDPAANLARAAAQGEALCAGKPYDASRQGCCAGKTIYQKTPVMDQTKHVLIEGCCGDKVYTIEGWDSAQKKMVFNDCCENREIFYPGIYAVPLVSEEDSEEAEKELKRQTDEYLWGERKVCCGGEVLTTRDRMEEEDFMGNEANPETRGCCAENIWSKESDGVAYDKYNQICCGGNLSRRWNPPPLEVQPPAGTMFALDEYECCGDKPYRAIVEGIRRINACCTEEDRSEKVYNLATQQCCEAEGGVKKVGVCGNPVYQANQYGTDVMSSGCCKDEDCGSIGKDSKEELSGQIWYTCEDHQCIEHSKNVGASSSESPDASSISPNSSAESEESSSSSEISDFGSILPNSSGGFQESSGTATF